MTEDENNTTPGKTQADTNKPAKASRTPRPTLRRDAIIAFVLLILTVLAMMLENWAPAMGFWFWLILAGLSALGCAWSADDRWKTGPKLTVAQLIHWSGFVVMYLALVYLRIQEIGGTSAVENAQGGSAEDILLSNAFDGLISPALIVLIPTTFYAGLRFGRSFLILALFQLGVLGASVIIADYLWVTAVLAGIVLVAMLI
ncbi:MAG: hypothetical protein AAGB34_07260, partial [Planctomycetota bacterium]